MGPRHRTDTEEPSPEDAFRGSFAIDCQERYLLHNRTPRRLCIVDRTHGEVVLPPLAERVIAGARLAPFTDQLRLLRQRHQLRVRAYGGSDDKARWSTAVVWLLVLATTVLAVRAVLVEGTLLRPSVLVPAGLAGAALLGRIAYAIHDEGRRLRKEDIADREEGDIEFGVGGAFYDGNETLRRTKHVVTLLGVVAIGAVLPAVAIFVATDAKEFLVLDGGLRVVDGKESRLVGRLVQVTYTAVLALFPAILYFQFDRHRVGTIRSEWVRAIFRVDRRMQTLADVNARYGDDLAEASSYSTDSVRLLGGRNSPIIVATLLMSLGWTLLVARTTSFDFASTTEATALVRATEEAADRAREGADPEAAATATELAEEVERVVEESTDGADGAPPAATEPPAEPAGEADEPAVVAAAASERAATAAERIEQPYFEFLVPTPSAATMAFLGAYFFGIYLLLRSYFRGDLRPKIYNQITARLLTVVVLAYLINTLFYDEGGQNRVVWAVAFVAGIVPTTVLQQVGRLASGAGGALLGNWGWYRKAYEEVLSSRRSLTDIDGIDIHDSTRLETEGITDVPSLAGNDLVSVMIKTRLPIERLVDWTDQAVLVLLLDDDETEGLDPRVKGLRRIGIRTASAVVAASDGALGPAGRQAVEAIVGSPSTVANGQGSNGAASADGSGNGTVAATLDALAAQIRREPVMRQILAWRESEYAESGDCPTITVGDVGPFPVAHYTATPVVTPAR